MNCHRLNNLLSAYIDGELTGVEMIEIRRHLSDCPGCQGDLDQLRATKRLVGRLATVRPSDDLASRICTGLDCVQPYSFLQAWAKLWRSPFERLSPAMAMVSLVILGMLMFTARGVEEKLDKGHAASFALAQPVISTTLDASSLRQPPLSPVSATEVVSSITRAEPYGGVWISNVSYTPNR